MLTVIVPFCPDGGRRDLNYSWVTKRLRALLPGAEIIIPTQEQQPFSRSLTCNYGAKLAANDVLLFCDADMIFDMDLIENGLERVRGRAVDRAHESKVGSHLGGVQRASDKGAGHPPPFPRDGHRPEVGCGAVPGRRDAADYKRELFQGPAASTNGLTAGAMRTTHFS